MIRNRRLWIGVFVAALAAYSIWWWLAARTLQARVDSWVAEQRLAGATIMPESFRIGGYPFVFAISAEDITLSWPDGFGFSGRRLRISARPWSLHRFHVAATGGFAFDFPAGSERPAYNVAGETLRGSAHFADVALPLDLDLAADSVTAREKSSGENDAATVSEATVSMLDFNGTRPAQNPTSDTEVGLDVTLHLSGLSAPALERNPLGSTIADTAIHAQLMGALPAAANAGGLKTWRDAGGTIELKALSLQWGKLGVTGDGTVALDPDMQPEGAFSATLTGFDQTIDALIAAGWVKPGPGSLAKLALDVASTQDGNGQRTVKTPLTIQSRRISMGPIKLGEIPPLKLN